MWGLGTWAPVRDPLALPEPPASPGQAGHAAACGGAGEVAGHCVQRFGLVFLVSPKCWLLATPGQR